MKPYIWLLLSTLSVPAICNAGSLYLYTINFDPTPASQETSVSYLSESLITSSAEVIPGQVTVISSPGPGATPYPGVGFGIASPNSFDFAFNQGGSLQWLFQGNTDPITGVGTYDFSSSQLSSGLNVYNPAGDVVVQQLAAAPVIYQYTESWDATSLSAPTSFIYDSPVFLPQSVSPDPDEIQMIAGPGAGAQPYAHGGFFLAGNTLAEGYFLDGAGNSWLMSSLVSPDFDYPGTYSFASAEVQYIANNALQADVTDATGSVSVTVITPEPRGIALAAVAFLFFILATRRRIHRARPA